VPNLTGHAADLVERNGPDAATDLVIALARQHLIALDMLATKLNVPTGQLLNALEVAQMESLDDGS